MNYPIDEIEGIGPAYREKLVAVGIKNTDDFLKLCCDAKGRKTIAEKSGVGETHLLTWANMADLMRVSGVGRQYAELLKATGVDTVKELRNRKPDNLATAMKATNDAKKLAKSTPNVEMVSGWVSQAKEMDPKITH